MAGTPSPTPRLLTNTHPKIKTLETEVMYNDCFILNSNNNNDNTKDLVVNLSDYALSKDETSVLTRGMKFCPTPGEPDFGSLREDLNKFHLRLKRRLFFSNLPKEDDKVNLDLASSNDQDDAFSDLKFKNPSKWKPPPVTNLELFCRQNEIYLLNKKVPPTKQHNLTHGESQALKKLSRNKNIVIKPADKGGAVVVQNTLDYINEGLRQLSDTKFYKETDIDRTHLHTEDINHFLKDLFDYGEIDEKCYDFLKVDKERASLFYMLPKIHKRLDNPPGRPIVSGNGCPTEKISQLVDFFLQPTVPALPSYVQDTTHFLSKLNDLGTLPEGSLLVTMDVASLYTNIPNEQGIEAVRDTLSRLRPVTDKPSTEHILTMLRKVLTMNNFEFAGRHFLQVGGTAMGTKVAPSFANTYMGWFERNHVYTYHKQLLLWVRFIDDIFQIWQHGLEKFRLFENHLNNCEDSIKFETDISETAVHFLDTTVTLDKVSNRINKTCTLNRLMLIIT